MADGRPDSHPRLAPGVRLHHDRVRGTWVLLSPERIIETEGPAHAILARCDGTRSVDQIVDELAAEYAAPREEIAGDVAALLAELSAKRMVLS